MQRMTGIDPMFIYSDTPDTPMEIAYACVFDPSSLSGGYSFERVTAVLQTRIPTLQPFRRRRGRAERGSSSNPSQSGGDGRGLRTGPD